jgi:hypothetical protein
MLRPYHMVAFLLAASTASGEPPAGLCDPQLQAHVDPLNIFYRYSQRGDRCEGLHRKLVAGSSLALQSLTVGIANYATTTSPKLFIRWPHLPVPPPIKLDEKLQIRASRLSEGPPFQMDTQTPLTALHYAWSAEMVRSLVQPQELGLLVQTQSPELVLMKVVFPAQLVDPQGGNPTPGPYRLGFLPGAIVENVQVTIAPFESGSIGAHLRDKERLKFTPAPKDEPLFLEIPSTWFRKTGLYWVAISATTRDGQALSEQFYLVHQSPQVHEKPLRKKAANR